MSYLQVWYHPKNDQVVLITYDLISGCKVIIKDKSIKAGFIYVGIGNRVEDLGYVYIGEV